MKKALFLYSNDAGHGNLLRHYEEIVERLSSCFDVLDCQETLSQEDGATKAKTACGNYDVLIVAGGDGTFNNIVNAIALEPVKPTLGYLNLGTLNDVGKNFGIRGSYKNGLKAIEAGESKEISLVRINDRFFVYMAAIGAFSDIAYSAKRNAKKRIGKFTYYLQAIGKAFCPKTIHYEMELDGEKIQGKTPFVLLMNGTNVGGFKVNSKGDISDDKVEIYLTKPGLFNGLVHYFFGKVATKKYAVSSGKMRICEEKTWCLDGEPFDMEEATFAVYPAQIRVFCTKKVLK